MNLKTLAVVILMTVLTACASNDTVTNQENPSSDALVCKVPLTVEPIPSIQWRDYEWNVLNTEMVEEMIDDGQDIRYIALTSEDFRRYSLTMQDILRYVRVQEKQKQEILEYYQKEKTN